MKSILFLLSGFILSFNVLAQEKYWVFFTDKDGASFSPYEYFDQKAIDRRIQNNLSLHDPTDFPLNQHYIAEVDQLVEEITTQSRWFNAVAVWVSCNQIKTIKTLPFVKDVQPIVMQSVLASQNYDIRLSKYDQNLLKRQTEHMQGSLFHEANIDGSGIRIAIFDGGFPSVNTNPVFEHIRKNNQIIKTWDFVKKKEFVYGYVSHGTMVMSCIGGIANGQKLGLATGAEFLLARTEVITEPYSEEENWLAAAEWADKNGADIINSSLGYTHSRYFKKDMNGRTSLVSRAANMAAKKGILVVNAAGNDGTSEWKYINTPADADSVLAVGGINPATDYHASFSSYGPTADKRMKPNVSAFAHVVAAGKKGLKNTQGTSFASPLVAGFAACAWQNNKELNNMELFEEIQKSTDLFPYYDYAHGYGVPQANYFLNKTDSALTGTTFEFVENNGTILVVVDDKININEPCNYLYYHIESKDGILDKYSVINVFQREVLKLHLSHFKNNEILRVHYKGYTTSYKFK